MGVVILATKTALPVYKGFRFFTVLLRCVGWGMDVVDASLHKSSLLELMPAYLMLM